MDRYLKAGDDDAQSPGERDQLLKESGEREACHPETLVAAVCNITQSFDGVHVGWGDASKFPQPMTLEIL
jgi:uncharacterized protein YyaL (SSP411 family)